jgi:hypothetical protein
MNAFSIRFPLQLSPFRLCYGLDGLPVNVFLCGSTLGVFWFVSSFTGSECWCVVLFLSRSLCCVVPLLCVFYFAVCVLSGSV